MVEIREYFDATGHNPYRKWFRSLNPVAAAKLTSAVTRMGQENFSNVKGVGAGVFECRLNFGPGYRVYFGKDGERIVILLGGGMKQRQQSDIENAQRLWAEYKRNKV